MAAGWKSRLADPAGSVPGGLRNLFVWGGIAALVAAVGWNSLQRQRELEPPPPPNPAEAQPPPEAAMAAEGELRVQASARRMDEEERRAALQATAARLEEQKRRRALQAAVGEHLRDPAGTLPPGAALPPGEYAELDVIAEEIRQTEQRRLYESLRAPQIVLAVETPAPGARPGQGREAPAAPEGRGPDGAGGQPGGGADAPPPTPAPAQAAAPEAPPAGSPAVLVEPSDPRGWERIYEGEFLECVLTTQLRGDFAGPANAMVAADLWSRDRQRVVVPRGSRVLGTAAAVAGTSQARLAVAFHRLIYPSGAWVDLDQFTGLNQMGETGLKDRVNNHYASMFGAAAAVGLLSGLAMQGAQTGFYGFGVSARDRAQIGLGAGMAEAGMSVVQRFTNRMPTVTIRAGHRVRVWFTNDVLVPRGAGAGRQ